jgi:hypothetical protein
MIIPPVTGTYEQERLALWLEVGRVSESAAQNSALIGVTKDKLEGDTRRDVNELGAKIRRVENGVLVIKTKAIAYGTAAGFAVTGIIEAIRYFHR